MMTTTKPQSTTEETLEPCGCEVKMRQAPYFKSFVCNLCNARYELTRVPAAPVVDNALRIAVNSCRDVTTLGRFAPAVDPVRWVAQLQAHLEPLLNNWAVTCSDDGLVATAAPVEQKSTLPDHYLCIAPDEQPTVVNFLRGYGTDENKKLAQLHLNLCLRCQELANAAPVEQQTFKNAKEAMLYAQRNNIPAVVPVGPFTSARAAAEEISSTFGLKLQNASLSQVAAIIQRHCG